MTGSDCGPDQGRLDQSHSFNAVWAAGYWTVLTGGLVLGAIATRGFVRALLTVGAALFAVVLIYILLMLTIGVRYLDRVLQSIERTRRKQPGGDEAGTDAGA